MEEAITFRDVVRRFGSHTAVDQLSFGVKEGEIFGLLGPNGSGKTTSINLITGLLGRNAGQVAVLGFDPDTQARQVRRRIGLVPQDTNVYGDLSAADNLRHHAALYCSDLSQAEKRIEELLRLMELWERRKDPVRTYSGGMKRRLALARALLHDPRLVLFDEPTLGVDVQVRHVLWEHVRAQREAGTTFVVSTNDMAEADALCDRLLILDHGRAVAMDTPERLKAALGRDIVTLHTHPAVDDPEALFAGLGVEALTRPSPDRLRLEVACGEKIVGELIGRVTPSYHLESVSIARPSLDDVFLHHTGRGLRE
jgi:ABC-2 type transport system ATP-binding protein